MIIRSMCHGDVGRVAAIERAAPSPWPDSSLVRELERPHGLQLVAAGDDDDIWGWCCGRYTLEDAELFKIAVALRHRRCGIGSALLLRFESCCRDRGCTGLFLEVRAANSRATSLYRRLGYDNIGCRKDYYTAPQDDALIFRKSLSEQT